MSDDLVKTLFAASQVVLGLLFLMSMLTSIRSETAEFLVDIIAANFSLASATRSALEAALEVPKKLEHGHLALPVFPFAKELRKGPPIIAKETAQRIVRFVAQKGEEIPIEEIEAVPPILSLLCRELNERRFTQPAGTPEAPVAQITFRESEADIETIIAGFYERCVAGRPDAVRIFIEEELVSPYSGARLQQDERGILKVFADGYKLPGATDDRRAAGYGDPGAARACLEELVNQRLLTAVSGGENPA